MTGPAPIWKRLVPLDIPIDYGMIAGTSNMRRATHYRYGLDVHGEIYLIYQHDRPSLHANRPRLSVKDPKWTPWHGLRYIAWVSP